MFRIAGFVAIAACSSNPAGTTDGSVAHDAAGDGAPADAAGDAAGDALGDAPIDAALDAPLDAPSACAPPAHPAVDVHRMRVSLTTATSLPIVLPRAHELTVRSPRPVLPAGQERNSNTLWVDVTDPSTGARVIGQNMFLENGEYVARLRVPEGTYRLDVGYIIRAENTPYLFHKTRAPEPIVVCRDATATVVTTPVELVPRSITVDASPMAPWIFQFAQVSVMTADGRSDGLTNITGTGTAQLPAGMLDADVLLVAPGGTQLVSFAPPDLTTNPSTITAPASRTVSGTVVDPDQRSSSTNVMCAVDLSRLWDPHAFHHDLSAASPSESSQYRMPVPTGRQCRLHGQYVIGSFWVMHPYATAERLPANGHLSRNLAVPQLPAGADLTGTVRDADGAPLPWEIYVDGTLRDLDARVHAGYQADAGGAFTISLPPGDYDLVIQNPVVPNGQRSER